MFEDMSVGIILETRVKNEERKELNIDELGG